MAAPWIKWTKGLHRKREIIGIADRLGIAPIHAAGLCMAFWEWLDDNITETQIDANGNAIVTLGALQPQFIDRLLGADGFAAALTAEGWLHVRSGSLVVPNFTRHNSQTGKTRAVTAARVDRHRKNRDGVSSCNGSVTLTPLLEKKREEKKNDDDVVVEDESGKGGAGGKPSTSAANGVTPHALQETAEAKAFRAYGELWGRGGPRTKRDRVLLWRICVLAVHGADWAQAALEAATAARPRNPGAYIQRMLLDLTRTSENPTLALRRIPVPYDVAHPPVVRQAGAETTADSEHLPPDQAREALRAAMAAVRGGANPALATT